MGDFTLDLKAVLTIISIITTITLALIFQWWKNRKRLSYEILTDKRLINISRKINDKVQIFLNKTKVDRSRLLVLKIINDGRQPIPANDFEKPLSIKFTDKVQIISIEKIVSKPENLEVNYNVSKHDFSLNPLLLNIGDFVILGVCTNAFKSDDNKFVVNSRIVGIKEAKNINLRVSVGNHVGFIVTGLFMGYMISQIKYPDGFYSLAGILLIALFFLIFISYILALTGVISIED